MKTNNLSVRRSLIELQREYDQNQGNELEKLVTAWAYIKSLPADDPNSFFVIGGYHGEPFLGEGAKNQEWWGGYCNHANVLFPTWHRAYIYRLEKALQTAPGCEDVMLPYWDQTDEYSTTYGIPRVLTDQYFTFKNAVPQCLIDRKIACNGNTIANPLASFTLPVAIDDLVAGNDSDYSKPTGYATVRYPLSGLEGTPQAQKETEAHNAIFSDYNTNVALLNANILQWLNNKIYYVPDASPTQPPGTMIPAGIVQAYKDCLEAPNYNAFSNTQSAAYYSSDPGSLQIVPLEGPHNDIHLSIGGFNLPDNVNNGGPDFSQIPGANADMGENDTAALDPIFFFHHCNVDRMFWIWQQKHGCTDHFDIIADSNDPGTSTGYNSANGQGPANGQLENEILTMQTALKPFMKSGTDYYTSEDCINIESQLNYTYAVGSLSPDKMDAVMETDAIAKKSDLKLHLSDFSRGGIDGSFIVAAYATAGLQKYLIGYHSALSRWHVGGCANCLAHLSVPATFSLNHYTEEQARSMNYHVEIIGREKRNKDRFGKFRALAATDYKPYKLEVK